MSVFLVFFFFCGFPVVEIVVLFFQCYGAAENTLIHAFSGFLWFFFTQRKSWILVFLGRFDLKWRLIASSIFLLSSRSPLFSCSDLYKQKWLQMHYNSLKSSITAGLFGSCLARFCKGNLCDIKQDSRRFLRLYGLISFIQLMWNIYLSVKGAIIYHVLVMVN